MIIDDRASSLFSALGMSGVPSWVVVDSENNVIQRISGAVSIQQFEELVDLVAGA